MTATLKVTIDAWADGEAIPEDFAFGVPADEGHIQLGKNVSPAIRWSGAPAGTRSFVVICHDPDVPSKPDNVNKEGVTVPADLPRVDFYHWILIDIPASTTEIPHAADADGITVGGKAPERTAYGLRGANYYTHWFAGDEAMQGHYCGYDGPCPPWNDEIVHHYHFTVYALDVEHLNLSGIFHGPEVLAAMEGHVLAKGTYVGTYTLNPDLR